MARSLPFPRAPRRQPKSAEARGFPSREEILGFIAGARGKVGKREIAREFGLNPAGKIALKRILKELQAEGALTRSRGALHRAGQLPPVIVADILRRDSDGDLIAAPAEWDEMRGEPPLIVIPVPRRREQGPPPGLNDRVLIRIEPTGDAEGPAYSGRILKILSHQAKRAVGVFRALPEGGGRLVPIDKKARGVEIAIPPGEAAGAAQDGDLVSVELGRDRLLGLRVGRVRERLGSTRSERAISLIAIHTHEIPHVFSEAALREAAAAQEATLAGREDWRTIPLVTIDPADAKDHDDAVHAEPDADPANPGGFVLHIAIADVAAYVLPGSALDAEALERGNSVYFPDRVVPMLPERISNDLCSLKPGVNRAALGLRVAISARGEKRAHSFHRVLIRSAGKLAYAQAQAAIDGRPDETTGPLLETVLRPLWAGYAALKVAREAREPLDLDLPERKLVLDRQGHVADVIVPERLDAHRLIEEFMILANVCAAETLEKARVPLLYRIHDNPSLEKMQGLRDFLDTIGISLPKQGAVRPDLFNRILARVKAGPHASLVNEVILRSQAQAEYAPENIGHFGLNLRRYAHFTSPIRRYADLVVHRGLIRALDLGRKDALPDTPIETMREIGARISAAERRAMAAERETVDRLIALYLADQVGASFRGRIAGVTRAGLFVKLDRTGADGFIPAASLGDDFFRHDEAGHALTGSRTGESYRLGDEVQVRLVEAQPMAGALRFEMLSEGRYVKTGRGRRLPPAQEAGGAAKGRLRAGRADASRSGATPRRARVPRFEE
ncbi:ribonuclease R [Rhabdaerophilum calidifontis]|uniref:ribonuclease R n=1 Tax=Rhabdaerophilum calidifontis TaxID=2604328 RepID=UPI00123ABEDA|nr:ribonuclease R [Rhabdaerophilum calidifontis]